MLLSPLPGVPQHLGGQDYRYTQGFGEHPETYDNFGLNGHNGFDLAPFKAGTKGIRIYSPLDAFARVKNHGKQGYGLHVVLTSLPHPDNGIRLEITLAHLESIATGIDGRFVKCLDNIGIMGSTGFSTNVHVHITPRHIAKNGSIMDYNNGFSGAQNLAPYFRIWLNKSPLIM